VTWAIDFFRWQRSNEPIDERYVGASFEIDVKHGLHADENTASKPDIKGITMDQMKCKWNI
jgi:hypothetical protein